MFVLVWEYGVRRDSVPEFEAAYGPDGTWAALFARASGYLGTDLYRIPAEPGRYLTVDRWRRESDWRAFHSGHADEYARLDTEFEAYTEWERRLPSGALDD